MYQWQSENSYELQPEDKAARLKLANNNSNAIMGTFIVSGLASWVATVGHRKDVYYYPLRAFIIKQICKVRPWRSLNPFASLAIQAGIFGYALLKIGDERIANYTHTFSQVCTPYGYMMRKLLTQVDDPKHKYKPAILTAQYEYDAEFERKVNELLQKPAEVNNNTEQIESDQFEYTKPRSGVPPRYQRKPRINRGQYSGEEKYPQQQEDQDAYNQNQHEEPKHNDEDEH